ncbi:MAG: hypothetical protein GY943_24410 [Chloroflexi bacterium]|nr:hypothetical protein [Chloroflexota bacterium]
MNRKRVIRLLVLAGTLFGLVLTVGTSSVLAARNQPHSTSARFLVTLENLTAGQPFSPPVAVTHNLPVRLFAIGTPASDAIEALAEDGNQLVAVNALQGSAHVTDLVDVGMPLTPYGTTFGDFTDTVTFEITARPGDRLSLATMLICTNDGFVGIDGARLPRQGTASYALQGYDAGTEANTESSSDLVDPCSLLGPVGLDGDPNGNENAAVNTNDTIQHHPGVTGAGDLLNTHNWDSAPAQLTITRIN